MEFAHKSVLLDESIEALAIKEDGIYVDCTLGGGGHSLEIVKRLKSGRLIAIDQDTEAIEAAKARLSGYLDRITFVHDNFDNLEDILNENAQGGADGVLFDLGVSSYQLDNNERGFSYHTDAPLDMRMDQSVGFSAFNLVNEYSASELERVIRDYGEERYAKKIAAAIVRYREEKPIETTLELAGIIQKVFPPKERFGNKNPARRSFQAIRIEVNHELDILPKAIDAAVNALKKGGRLAVITFHSLEDRAIKESINKHIDGCTCPKDFPVCVCGFTPTLRSVSRKPIVAGEKELNENSRAHSAKLRIAEKL